MWNRWKNHWLKLLKLISKALWYCGLGEMIAQLPACWYLDDAIVDCKFRKENVWKTVEDCYYIDNSECCKLHTAIKMLEEKRKPNWMNGNPPRSTIILRDRAPIEKARIIKFRKIEKIFIKNPIEAFFESRDECTNKFHWCKKTGAQLIGPTKAHQRYRLG